MINLAKYLLLSSVFLASFLLFSIQPLLGKYLLPYFGGSSSVWALAMFFFMSMLLFGYVLAFFLTKLVRGRYQALVYILLIALCLSVLILNQHWDSPILPNVTISNMPEVSLMYFLAMSIGIHFLLLSSVSTLLQYWVAQITKKEPYVLYAFSNAGGLLGLISYPLIIEPNLQLNQQASIWISVYVFLAACLFGISAYYFRKSPNVAKTRDTSSPTISMRLRWLIPATLSPALLLIVSTQITQEIAAAPLLWIAPLALYLLTYILIFSKVINLSQLTLSRLALFFLLVSAIISSKVVAFPIILQVATWLSLLIVGCLYLNKDLFDLRPKEKSHITHFYLIIAAGGMIAGLLISLLAPLALKDYFETQILLAVLLIIIVAKQLKTHQPTKLLSHLSRILTFVLIAVFAASTYSYLKKDDGLIAKNRNMYGVVSVLENLDENFGTYREIRHGNILHGKQFTDTKLRSTAITYYSEESGVGKILQNYSKIMDASPLSVAIIGLGAGEIAAYCVENDTFTFFEINPAVVEYSEEYFSYLSDCRSRGGNTEIILGDARLSISTLSDSKKFDILIVDAFSDDAIPTHLLTKEALDLYLNRLSDNGVIAVHISNRHLDLKPVLAGYAHFQQISAAIYSHSPQSENSSTINTPSEWVFLSRNQTLSETLGFTNLSEKNQKTTLWTDRYSNTLTILK